MEDTVLASKKGGAVTITKKDILRMFPHRGIGPCIDEATILTDYMVTGITNLDAGHHCFNCYSPDGMFLPAFWRLGMATLCAKILMKCKHSEPEKNPQILCFEKTELFIPITPQRILTTARISEPLKKNGHQAFRLNSETRFEDGRVAAKTEIIIANMYQ